MKKTHLLKGMLAMTAAFIIALTGCPSPNGPKSTPVDPQKPVEPPKTDSASGKYFSIKEDSKGLKVTLADGIKIQKDSGSHFWIEGIPFNMNITSEDIDNNRKDYIFPFVEKGKKYDLILGAFIWEDSENEYKWKTETLKCKAGGDLDFNTIFNMNNAYESKLTVSFSAEEELFSGKLETPINSVSDFIKDKSVLESAKSDFQILLGLTEWKNSKYAASTDVSFDYLSDDFSTNLAKAKAGFDFIYPNREITSEDWKNLHNMYCGLLKTIFKLKEFSDTEFEISSLWSEQMRYTSVAHESTMNIILNDDFPTIKLTTNHPWVGDLDGDGNNDQDMTKISNYERNLDITKLWGNDFPQKGDTVNISWTSIPDVDIKNVYCRLVENTASVDWWKELCEVDFDNLEPYTIAKDLKANVPFETSISLTLVEAPIEGISLSIWYNVGDATPDGPAKFDVESIATEAKGKYFSIKGTSEGIKITLADDILIQKASGSNFAIDGLPFTLNISDDNIENDIREYILPFAEIGKTSTIKMGAWISEDGGNTYSRKEETLECIAGGGLDYEQFFSLDFANESKLDIDYSEVDGKFTGKLETPMNAASDVIKNASVFEKADIIFNVALGKTNWEDTKWWTWCKDDIRLLSDEADSQITRAKTILNFSENKPKSSDWKNYNNQYSAYCYFLFNLKQYKGMEYTSYSLWSDQMTYTPTITVPHNSEINIALDEYYPSFKIAENHPWVGDLDGDGWNDQDMSVISNYENHTLDITEIWGDDFPRAGDTVNLTFTSICDIDVNKLLCRLIDTSSAANWWLELCAPDNEGGQYGGKYILKENIKAKEPFTSSISFTLTEDPIANLSVCLWYQPEDGSGEATFDKYLNNVSSVPSDATTIFDAFELTEIPANVELPAWGGYDVTLKNDSKYKKVLDFKYKGEGQWNCLKINFDKPINLKDKTLYIVMKGQKTETEQDQKVILYSGEEGSENYNFEPTDATSFIPYSAVNSDFWAAYEHDSISDWTKVDSLEISFQQADYDFQIASIYYK